MQGLRRSLREAATHINVATYLELARALQDVQAQRMTAQVDDTDNSDSDSSSNDDSNDELGESTKSKLRKLRKTIDKLKGKAKADIKEFRSGILCTKCKNEGHPASDCKLQISKCQICTKEGHDAKTCRFRNSPEVRQVSNYPRQQFRQPYPNQYFDNYQPPPLTNWRPPRNNFQHQSRQWNDQPRYNNYNNYNDYNNYYNNRQHPPNQNYPANRDNNNQGYQQYPRYQNPRYQGQGYQGQAYQGNYNNRPWQPRLQNQGGPPRLGPPPPRQQDQNQQQPPTTRMVETDELPYADNDDSDPQVMAVQTRAQI
ncbi:dr1-associated corepressor homolog [Selaginella moellendorffii]|uniref:dr1-associated corepressor homolog n=1 Tax=Selaginella moellendorffii TaxID=88036 RepID=UPI000D1CE188|nr:dr1-associated corepressor homolog [Selaginella moellendorffii]|eukprot:XP_024516628.1 dr1-associated corepressor homolog [Selaginella moellendorffii]